MRRLPIFFVIDVSESMIGDPINEVSNGIKSMIATLRQDPYALETVYISIIVFASRAKTVVPLTDLITFYTPQLPIGGGTSLGAAVKHLMYEMDQKIVKNDGERKGDWKPIIFLFTDGTPTDNAEYIIHEWETKRKSKSNMIAISVGLNTDLCVLKRLTDNVLLLNDMEKDAYKYFFKWISASISIQSQKIDSFGIDDFQLTKIDESLAKKAEIIKGSRQIADDNYVVLYAKCQKNAAPFLIKYRRNSSTEWDWFVDEEDYNHTNSTYVLTGAFPIVDLDEYIQLSHPDQFTTTINVMNLEGAPSCPCCGNPPGLGQCQCGGIHCLKLGGENICPYCGRYGEYQFIEGGFDLNRAQG